MASTVRTRLNHVKSEPPPPNISSLFKIMETIPSASTDGGILSGTQSLHTTPREEVESESFSNRPLSASAIGLRISVDNLPPISTDKKHGSHSARNSSRRESKRFKESNSSRGAGHTPPPSAQSKNANFNLVHDTDKKEGPINWWNLKVKMPDDNTMHILSPHRIPVPQTPTTPS